MQAVLEPVAALVLRDGLPIGRLEPNADGATLVDMTPEDVVRRLAAECTYGDCAALCDVIPEIDIWRGAQLILKRYGEKAARGHSRKIAARAEELARGDDDNGAAVWRRITAAVTELAKCTPLGV